MIDGQFALIVESLLIPASGILWRSYIIVYTRLFPTQCVVSSGTITTFRIVPLNMDPGQIVSTPAQDSHSHVPMPQYCHGPEFELPKLFDSPSHSHLLGPTLAHLCVLFLQHSNRCSSPRDSHLLGPI